MTDPDRSRRRFLALSLVILLPLVAGVLLNAARPTDKEPGGDELYKYLSIFSETFNLVRQNYVETTDVGTLIAGAMEGSTDALDPYSIFLPGSVTVAEEKDVVAGARHMGLVVLKERGVAFAAAVEAGSASAAAGISAGDVVSRVGGRPTRQMPLWAINHELAVAVAGAASGGEIELEIVRSGETRSVTIRGPAPPAAEPRIDEIGGFPMLILPRIDAGTVEAARALLGGLSARQPRKLIVDLRAVAGGEPEAAYALAGLFASGELGALRELKRDAAVRSFRSDATPAWAGEIAVLVDNHTAAGAEIVAAALRQSAGAKLVGVPSFGWAGERSRLELTGGARLLVTTAYFSAADGKPISESLAPDLLVDDGERRFAERDRPLSELILDRALEYLSDETPLAEDKAA